MAAGADRKQPLSAGPAPDVDADIRRILREVDRRSENVVDEMVAAIRAEVPEFAHPETRTAAGIRRHTADHLRAYLRSAEEERRPTPEELEFVRRAGTRRAAEDQPLDPLLHAYRVGQYSAWDVIVRMVRTWGWGDEAMLRLTRVAWEYQDAISTEVTTAFVEARHRVSIEADRIRRDVIENLLAGRLDLVDPARVRGLGLDLGEGASVIVVRGADDALPDGIVSHLSEVSGDGFVVARHDEVIAIATNADHVRALHSALETIGPRIRAGIGGPLTTLSGIAAGYGQACRAVENADTERPVVCLHELSVFEYLASGDDEVAVAMVSPAVRELLEQDLASGGTLAATLTTFYACDLDGSRTAERLFVHPNTVRYRLRKIGKATGIDPMSAKGLVELVIAVRLLHRD